MVARVLESIPWFLSASFIASFFSLASNSSFYSHIKAVAAAIPLPENYSKLGATVTGHVKAIQT